MKAMSLGRRLKVLERRLERSRPQPAVIPAAEVNDLDQYQAVMDASAMRADGRLAPGGYLDGTVDWQREFLDTYGEAIASFGHLERTGNVDPA